MQLDTQFATEYSLECKSNYKFAQIVKKYNAEAL